jgi:thioester reductase-like protein
MIPTPASPAACPRACLLALLADALELPEEEIDASASFLRQGLDSVAAVQLTAAVAELAGRGVPETVLLDYPDLNSLAGYVEAVRRELPPPARGTDTSQTWELMQADCLLPADILPAAPAPEPPRFVLLTGATGFLGAYLLHALLRDTAAEVVCLGRADDVPPLFKRLRHNLEVHGLWQPAFARRVQPVVADLGRPTLGLTPDAFQALCQDVDAVYHAAATVNWVVSYEGLRDVNVLGTRELLRLACRHRAKPFHFISSLAVCYTTTGPDRIDENEDVSAHLDGVHLGYAQTKVVAETLVRQAADRGLPATLHRPALLCGASDTGRSNPDDLLARMIRGCVRMGTAPDLDWVLDACPVDHVAGAIVGLTRRPGPEFRAFHLANPAPRQWRELVLWMSLYGYPVRLVPYESWREQLAREGTSPEHPLHPLRGFFLGEPVTAEGLTLPELYQDEWGRRIRHKQTRAALRKLPATCPPLSAALLDRCFGWWIDAGVLPPVPLRPRPTSRQPHPDTEVEEITEVLRRYYADDALEVCRLSARRGAGAESVLTELAAWRHGSGAGLARRRVRLRSRRPEVPATLDVFLKAKARDDELLDIATRLAQACNPEVGAAFARHGHNLGLAGGHLREIALYQVTDDRFRRHVPACYGSVCDEGRQRWLLVLEDVTASVERRAPGPRGWPPQAIATAVRGLAELHALWYGRETELQAQPWLGPVLTTATVAGMPDLWQALAAYSGRFFVPWLGAGLRRWQHKQVATVASWWQPLDELPRTLTHNDFNPRNLGLRRGPDRGRLCVYDWELATVGVPQHDLAEFLCFVLTPAATRPEVESFLDLHRTALERSAGVAVDAARWEVGFRHALADLGLGRWPLYTLMHTFRPQGFLKRVVRTWWSLVRWFDTGT